MTMKIKKINSQHRRDFHADFECEGCGYIEKNKYGYDDFHFHNNVIPSMICPDCGESSKSLGVDYRPLATKYPEGFQV
jgi:predicted RNA-binding Zn-ribbon protein involved in translation (DUF1610 family)